MTIGYSRAISEHTNNLWIWSETVTYDDIPLKVRTWIREMVDGTTSIEVGHMMFSVNENFRNLIPEYGLYLIRTQGHVRKWLDGASDEENRKERMCAVRDYTANAVRDLVITLFEKANYPGD
jgi:hypothetical protein